MGLDTACVVQVFLLGVTAVSALYKQGETECSTPVVANAILRRYDDYDVLEIECNEGFKLHGSSKLLCRDGEWEQDEFPMCVPQQKGSQCRAPVVPHASVHMDEGEMIADIKCNVGYSMKINGDSLSHIKLFCGQDKRWITRERYSNIPDCTSDLLCPEPRKYSFASEILPLWQPYREGTKVTYRCNPGYRSITYSQFYTDFEIRCHDGKWTGPTPTCVKMYGCSRPQDLQKGSWKVIPSFGMDALQSNREIFHVGTKVQYSCMHGMKLQGSNITQCLPGNVWSNYAPLCIETAKCIIQRISNGICHCYGESKYCGELSVGEKMVCACDSGYHLRGNSEVTCAELGRFSADVPYCVSERDFLTTDKPLGDGNVHMNTLAIVIATACSVLGVLLLVMVVMVFRRRKPRARLYHQVGAPPPYSRVHSNMIDEHDRVALIDATARLPSYEEAIRTRGFITTGRTSRDHTEERLPTTDYRPLPNIPVNLRSASETSNRHSIGTVSTVNRDGVSEVFGSIDTVNVSMSDASTSVTVDTLDSGASRPSNASGRATAGSLDSSRENLSNEDAPLLDNRNEEETVSEDVEIRMDEENKDT